MSSALELWKVIARKRIMNILKKRRISYSSHLEIKISEAGPNHMRAEPHIINQALGSLLADGLIRKYEIEENCKDDSPIFYVPKDFGSASDISRAKYFNQWRKLYLSVARQNEYCGYVLEKIIFDAVLKTNKYHVIGCGPEYNDKGELYKSSNSEVLSYQGKNIYKADKGAGFDLFLIHKKTNIPIGIEAKNIREWIYPASPEVWRTIARACTIDCLPVLMARKISYITKAGFFAHFGMLGYNTNFQFFDSRVQRDTKYKFKKNVVNKERLGFADIKLKKPNDEPPDYIINFFDNILDNNVYEYYLNFMEYKNVLKKYAIDYKMAEKMNQRKRFILYCNFKDEVNYEDIEVSLEPEL